MSHTAPPRVSARSSARPAAALRDLAALVPVRKLEEPLRRGRLLPPQGRAVEELLRTARARRELLPRAPADDAEIRREGRGSIRGLRGRGLRAGAVRVQDRRIHHAVGVPRTRDRREAAGLRAGRGTYVKMKSLGDTEILRRGESRSVF